MEQEEFDDLSNEEKEKEFEELKQSIGSKIHLVDNMLDRMVKEATNALIANDEIDVLSMLHSANVNALPPGTTDIILAAAIMRLAKQKDAIPTKMGEVVILASLNIDKDEVQVSSDVMQVWSQLYSVSHGGFFSERRKVKQIEVDGMLFLVAEPKKNPGKFGDTVTVISGNTAEELDKLLKDNDAPDVVREAVMGVWDALSQGKKDNLEEIIEGLPDIPGAKFFVQKKNDQ